jgi:Pvc16 N-terminal domain
MSNPLSVSAVTATLRNLLDRGTRDNPPGTLVTTRPLDKARGSNTSNQLNIFLYQTTLSAAWRNTDMPWQVRPGETGAPPLPLNLYYLLTAYGENDDDDLGHLVLGSAMSILHDHPVISSEDIRLSLVPDELPKYDLQDQREGIRITYQPMSLEEMSKLWTTFQTQYRISAAYQVAVVLIDSLRPTRAPLPVLRQGPGDDRPLAQADLTPPFPTLLQLRPPDTGYSAELGDTLTITGHHLAGDRVEVRLRHRLLDTPNTLLPEDGSSDRQLTVRLPKDPAAAATWPVGRWDLWAVIVTTVNGRQIERPTNELPLDLAPHIENIAPNPARRDPNGRVRLTLTLTPQVRLEPPQRASLLIADREVLAEPPTLPPPPAVPPTRTPTLAFVVAGLQADDYFVRLRVDGVDSILVDRAASPIQFDNGQKVTIQ